MRQRRMIVLALLLIIGSSSCDGTPNHAGAGDETASVSAGPVNTPMRSPVAVLIGAGDVATSSGDQAATAAIIDQYPEAVVFTTGDNAYPDGTADDYSRHFDPSWGVHKDRIRPAIGNHDAHSEGAMPYFSYFGANAGTPGEGWYSYELGTWHVIVLNSECGSSGLASCDDQFEWLSSDLADRTQECMLAYWHRPVFNAGRHEGDSDFADEWEMLDAVGVDVVLNGHDHNYQRYGLQDASGMPTPNGIREFVVGTGGAKIYGQETDLDNLQAFYEGHGVLKLELFESSYSWEFIPVVGPFEDTGTGSCEDI